MVCDGQVFAATEALEMIVEDSGKMLGLEKHLKFGLWHVVKKTVKDNIAENMVRDIEKKE